MNAKKRLDLNIDDLEKEIKNLETINPETIKEEGLENEELEARLNELRIQVDEKNSELEELKSTRNLYDETKDKILKLQSLKGKKYVSDDELNEMNTLSREIKEAKETLGEDLTAALEEETNILLIEDKHANNNEEIVEKTPEENSENEEEHAQEEEPNHEETNTPANEQPQEPVNNNPTVEFDDHVSSYEALINEKIRKLEAKIKKINNTKLITTFGNVNASAKVKALQTQIDLLKKEKERIHTQGFETTNPFIVMTDEEIKDKNQRIKDLNDQIEKLKQAKANIKGRLGKKIVESQMRKRNNKIKKLEHSKVKIVGRQKTYLMPKLYKELFSNRKFANITGKTEAYAETVNDMEELSKSTSGLFVGIQKARYESIGKHYQKKLERTQKILEKLNEKNGAISLEGQTSRIMPENIAERLSSSLQNQTQKTNTNEAVLAA